MENLTRAVRLVTTAAVLLTCLAVPPGAAQQPQQPAVARLVAEPARITIRAGQELPFRVIAYDAQGNVIPNAPIRVTGPRMVLSFEDDVVRAFRAGTFTAQATSVGGPGTPPVTLDIPVTVTWPALTKLQIVPEPGRLYTGVMLAHDVKAFHEDGTERPGVAPTWRSSAPAIATVDRFGNVTAIAPGNVTITADAEDVRAEHQHTVVANPVTTIDVAIRENTVFTGDVVQLAATAKRSTGASVPDAPITWSYTYSPDDSIAAPGGPGIIEHGKFAANAPGRYTLIASAGTAFARKVIEVRSRDVRRRIAVTGRGNINHVHTSDLWPYTGRNGRDYALVGTWGGDGYAYVFDITDLSNIVKTDSVKIDARTINDVTVSPDARYGALSREGASNRVNGVVILDLADPAHPQIASTFDQELTGGVHNMFATNDHLFAVSGGAKYVIIDVKDLRSPKYVSEYRHPNARLHDLWVHDGIAYSAQGGVGTIVVDVGNGKYGGTIEKPKLITFYAINSGHEIFPYFQQKTGKVYLFIGDEIMNRRGRVWEGSGYTLGGPDGPPRGGIAQNSAGYTHIVDFTDPQNAREVAKYHLEDYGSHDIIVEDDVMYQAYYDGGVRIVDVSGELLGNLADQRREIAVFKPYDPQGYTPNAPFVMNAMPWKGHVLFTDFNSGLWAAKLEPKPVTF